MFEWIVSFIAIFGLLYRWTDQIAVPHILSFIRGFEHTIVFMSAVLFLLIMLYVVIKQAKRLPKYYHIEVMDVFGKVTDARDLRLNFQTYQAAKSYSMFYNTLYGEQYEFRVVGNR